LDEGPAERSGWWSTGTEVECRAENGRWVEIVSFEQPLDADRFFAILVEARGSRPLRVVRYAVVVAYDPPQEG